MSFFIYLVIIFSAVIHEYAHGFIANQMGDPTARLAGRLTLNPLKHIDPFGTVIFPLLSLSLSGVFIGWAKPVPYNPNNLSDKKYGSLKVALAGPASNLIIAAILGMLIRFAGVFVLPINFAVALSFITYINIFLALFNILPFPPLDGSKIFADLFPAYRNFIYQAGIFGVIAAIAVAFIFLPRVAGILYFIITGQYLF